MPDPQPLTAHARDMRREMTPAEARFWTLVRRRALGVRFRRQLVIGGAIVDFACRERRLIVEFDGLHHEHETHDGRRDAALVRSGWRILRVWNPQMIDAEFVQSAVRRLLDDETIGVGLVLRLGDEGEFLDAYPVV